MAIIIDANRTGDFSEPRGPHADEIIRRIKAKRMRVCLGGKLGRELLKTKLGKILVEWSRAGCIDRFSDAEIDSMATDLIGSIESDDEHVVALACISGCRLIYTNDEALIRDLKNTKLVSPRGKIVKNTTTPRIAKALFESLGG